MNTRKNNGTPESAEEKLLASKFTQGQSLIGITSRERMEQFINQMGYVSGDSDKAYDLSCKLDRCTDLEVRAVYELYLITGSKITFSYLFNTLHAMRFETLDQHQWEMSYQNRIQWLNHVFSNIEFFSSISIDTASASVNKLLKYLKLPLGLIDSKARLYDLIVNINPVGVRILCGTIINKLSDIEAHAIWELVANASVGSDPITRLDMALHNMRSLLNSGMSARIEWLTQMFEYDQQNTINPTDRGEVQRNLF